MVEEPKEDSAKPKGRKAAPKKKTKQPNMIEREGENKLNLGKRTFKDKAGKSTEVPVLILLHLTTLFVYSLDCTFLNFLRLSEISHQTYQVNW